MEAPSVVHPKKIDLFGFIFEVTTFMPLTDEQALAVALFHYRGMKRRPAKRDRGKQVFPVVSWIDADQLRLLSGK